MVLSLPLRLRPDSGSGQGLRIRRRIWGMALGASLGVSLGIQTPAWSGEYFTEEVTSPSIEVIHGWRAEVDGIEVTITNSSRGSIQVLMEVSRRSCGEAEMVLQSGRVLPVGEMEDCVLNLFPFLDKLINQEVAGFRVALEDRLLEIPVSEADRLLLARVGNQSREAFIFFQEELARVMDMLRQAAGDSVPAAAAPSEGAPLSIPTPASLAPQESSSQVRTNSDSAELVIVGGIQEERLGAGSRLQVEAINPTEYVVVSAVARFDFYRGDRIVDTRRAAFNPSDVLPGQRVTAEVVKTETDWDRVTVSFEWRR